MKIYIRKGEGKYLLSADTLPGAVEYELTASLYNLLILADKAHEMAQKYLRNVYNMRSQ